MLQTLTLRYFPRLAQWLGIPALLQLQKWLKRVGLSLPLVPAYCRVR